MLLENLGFLYQTLRKIESFFGWQQGLFPI